MGTPSKPLWLIRYRAVLIAAGLALSLAAATQLPRLSFDFSPQLLFEVDDDHPETRRWRETVETFGRGDGMMFVVLDAGPGGDALRPEVRAYLRALGERFAAHQAVARVSSLATVTTVWSGADGIQAGVALERAREALIADPLLAGTLVSADGSSLSLLLEVAEGHRFIDGLTELVEALEAWFVARPPPPGIELALAGIPFVRVEIVRALLRDQLFYLPAAALIATLFLMLVTRSLRRSLLLLVPVAVTLAWASGLSAALGLTVNIVSHVVPILIIVIGVSDALHLAVRYQDEVGAGLESRLALSRTTRVLALACLLTSLTTAVGFASLAATRSPVIREFGLLCAVAVLMAYVATIGLLPGLLSLAPTPPTRRRAHGALSSVALACGRLALRRPRAVALSLALAAAGAATVGWIRVEADIHLMDYFPADHDNRKAQRLMEERLGGALTADVIVKLSAPSAHLDPAVLESLARAQREFLELDGVTHARSVADLSAAIHRAIDAGEATRALPDSREAAAQEWLLAELSGAALPLETLIADHGRTLRIHLRWRDLGGRAWLRLAERIRQITARAFADHEVVELFVTGDAQQVSRSTTTLIQDLAISLSLAAGVIFLVLLALLRSWRLAAVSILPNTLPLLFTAGFMGALRIDLDVSNAVIFSISLGLAVDDTIHVLARFREERREGGNIDEVIARTMVGSGQAVILTSAVLGVGMLLLLTSSFGPTRSFGLLTGVTLFTALLADLLLLPALLKLAYGHGRS